MYPLVTDVFLRLKAPYQRVSCFAAAADIADAALLLICCWFLPAFTCSCLHVLLHESQQPKF